MTIKQTAGRNLSLRDRSLVTVVALMVQIPTDDSFKYHLINAKTNGMKKEKIVETIPHAAFYAGWSKTWTVFHNIKGNLE